MKKKRKIKRRIKMSSEMKAYTYPIYVDPHSNFVSKIKDVEVLFNRLCTIGIDMGADIEYVSNRPSCKMVFWKETDYSVVIVTIFEGKERTDDFIVEIQCTAGDKFLFRNTYVNIVNTAINYNLVDSPKVSPPRSISMPKQDEKYEVNERDLKNLFHMFEYEFFESRLTAGHVLMDIYKNCRESDREMIKTHPKLIDSLKVLLLSDISGQPDVKCATICLLLAVEMKIQIDADVVERQVGIMWKEAKRQLVKLRTCV